MEEIVTHLEMTSLADLRPAPPVPEVSLERVPVDSPLIRPTTVRIGTPYDWPSTTWSDADWADYLARPGRECWLIRYDTDLAGLADFQTYRSGDVEITTFGLLPEYVGKGIGGHALSLVITQAWQAGDKVRRVWLHTSTLDHPHALPNYRSRGFRPFRTVRSER